MRAWYFCLPEKPAWSKDLEFMKTPWKELVTAIHQSGYRVVLAVTGGGSQAIGKLLSVPGGSSSLLEAVVPYSPQALAEFLGGSPDQACSEPTARAMAMVAWMRARRLTPDQNPLSLVGLGCTASLASERPKRGDHRIHLALQTLSRTASLSVELMKGNRSRSVEERLCASLLLLTLGEACQRDTTAAQSAAEDMLFAEEQIERRGIDAPATWSRLILGEQQFISWPSETPRELPRVLFPGAFNPLHSGHQRMAEIASQLTSAEVAYELSITNVDKPPLDFIEIAGRLASLQQHDPQRTAVLTAAPTFVEKARLFPETTFVVGADTIERIADPRFYGDSPTMRDDALREIDVSGGRFLVFGRQLGDHFCTLRGLSLPPMLQRMCDEVPEAVFHLDISSSELRKKSEPRRKKNILP